MYVLAEKNVRHSLTTVTGYKTLQFDSAPFGTDSVHGSRCIRMDTSVVSNWQKACIFAVHDNHAAGYAIRGYSRKLLSALDRGFFARPIGRG